RQTRRCDRPTDAVEADTHASTIERSALECSDIFASGVGRQLDEHADGISLLLEHVHGASGSRATEADLEARLADPETIEDDFAEPGGQRRVVDAELATRRIREDAERRPKE